jgi:hypothetical protein
LLLGGAGSRLASSDRREDADGGELRFNVVVTN